MNRRRFSSKFDPKEEPEKEHLEDNPQVESKLLEYVHFEGRPFQVRD